MKLTRLMMDGFRSYREPVEVRFEPGTNVFLGRNEAGKTGILLAIQAALFEPRLASERELLVSEGSEVCRVGLEYELPDGRRFQVARDLVGHRGSIAQWRGEQWQVQATSVGDIALIVREHTGCDEALFKATLLVRHEAIEIGDADDLTRSLTDRIERLVSGSPGGISAARAAKKLETEVKGLSGPRAGLVAVADAALREAEMRLNSAKSSARRLEEGRPRVEDLAQRSSALESEAREAIAVLERARRAAGLETKKRSLEAERAGIDRTLDAQAEVERLGREMESVRRAAPVHGGLRVPLLVFAGLLALGALITLAMQWWAVGAGLVVASAIAALAGWRSRRPAQQPVVAPTLASPELPRVDLGAERARLGRDLEEVEAALNEAALHRLEPVELARLEIRASQLPEQIRAADNARIRAEVELQNLEEAGSSLSELEDEVEVARQKVDRLTLRLDAMKLAQQELEAAIQDIRLGVGPELAAEASRLLGAVAPGTAVALGEGAGMRFLPAGPDGEELGRRQLSDGTVDQFHFAVRVALAGVLLGDLKPPLLLDDPFRYADEGRRESLHAMLEELAAGRQVLYFTVEDPAPLAVTHRLPVVASRAGAE